MRHNEKDAVEVLRELRSGHTQDDYIELMWLQRYPKAPARSNPGWPYRNASELPTKHMRIVK